MEIGDFEVLTEWWCIATVNDDCYRFADKATAKSAANGNEESDVYGGSVQLNSDMIVSVYQLSDEALRRSVVWHKAKQKIEKEVEGDSWEEE